MLIIDNPSVSKNHGKNRHHCSRTPNSQSNHFSCRLVEMIDRTAEGSSTAACLVSCDDEDEKCSRLRRYVSSVSRHDTETSRDGGLLLKHGGGAALSSELTEVVERRQDHQEGAKDITSGKVLDQDDGETITVDRVVGASCDQDEEVTHYSQCQSYYQVET